MRFFFELNSTFLHVLRFLFELSGSALFSNFLCLSFQSRLVHKQIIVFSWEILSCFIFNM